MASISPVSSPIESMLIASSGKTFNLPSARLRGMPCNTSSRLWLIAPAITALPVISLTISSDKRIGTPARVSELKVRQNWAVVVF
jgi:hypothetical protein